MYKQLAIAAKLRFVGLCPLDSHDGHGSHDSHPWLSICKQDPNMDKLEKLYAFFMECRGFVEWIYSIDPRLCCLRETRILSGIFQNRSENPFNDRSPGLGTLRWRNGRDGSGSCFVFWFICLIDVLIYTLHLHIRVGHSALFFAATLWGYEIQLCDFLIWLGSQRVGVISDDKHLGT